MINLSTINTYQIRKHTLGMIHVSK